MITALKPDETVQVVSSPREREHVEARLRAGKDAMLLDLTALNPFGTRPPESILSF